MTNSTAASLLPLAFFIVGVAAVLLILDARLAKRAGEVIDLARSEHAAHQDQPAGLEPWVFRLGGVETDVCNALTGGLWFAFTMPRSGAMILPPGMEIRPLGGHCRR